jgi:hypothetical protein
MMANGQILKQITVDFDKLAAKAGVTVAQARNEYLNRLSREVVENTPVKTGRLRASWFLSPTLSSSPGDTSSEATKVKGAPGVTMTRLSLQTETLAQLDGSVYLLNGANYAIFVEARTQFLRKVLARSRAIANAVVTEIKNIKATGIP